MVVWSVKIPEEISVRLDAYIKEHGKTRNSFLLKFLLQFVDKNCPPANGIPVENQHLTFDDISTKQMRAINWVAGKRGQDPEKLLEKVTSLDSRVLHQAVIEYEKDTDI